MITKFKSNIILKSFKDTLKIYCIIELTNHFLKILITEKLTNIESELINKRSFYSNESF